jgi:non-ribosomal peptide synthetase component F
VTDPTEAKTLPQLIRGAAKAFGDAIAIRAEGEAVLSYSELDRQSSLLGRGLLARGIGKGSRVGFICGNGPQFATMLFAIARIGAVAVPISTMIRANELIRVLRQSDICGLVLQREFLGNDYAERLSEALPALRQPRAGMLALPEAPYLRWVASTGPDLPSGIADLDWLTSETASEELLLAVEAEVLPARWPCPRACGTTTGRSCSAPITCAACWGSKRARTSKPGCQCSGSAA